MLLRLWLVRFPETRSQIKVGSYLFKDLEIDKRLG